MGAQPAWIMLGLFLSQLATALLGLPSMFLQSLLCCGNFSPAEGKEKVELPLSHGSCSAGSPQRPLSMPGCQAQSTFELLHFVCRTPIADPFLPSSVLYTVIPTIDSAEGQGANGFSLPPRAPFPLCGQTTISLSWDF